ncbi:hypothetical protein PIB30_066046 [Stylosanthes scabra]|uniref:Uncharacterized protein n=1 Tax=Stylosanthes scabra TaxID=79078 RepID=A0ABU6XK20_9FABA|nr:hypothetical protein [Stylosanthes scabra]
MSSFRSSGNRGLPRGNDLQGRNPGTLNTEGTTMSQSWKSSLRLTNGDFGQTLTWLGSQNPGRYRRGLEHHVQECLRRPWLQRQHFKDSPTRSHGTRRQFHQTRSKHRPPDDYRITKNQEDYYGRVRHLTGLYGL